MFRKLLTQNSLAQQLSALQLQHAPSLLQAAASSSQAQAAASPQRNEAPQRPLGKWWGNRLTAHIKFHAKREAQERMTVQVRERSEVYMDPSSNKTSMGDMRLNKLNWWLNNLGVQRSPDQALFHKHFTNACLPKIYGAAEWNDASVRVMRMRGIQSVRAEVTAITPRRWGKTWSVAMFVLSMMLSCPGIRICVFSTGKRASSSLMEIITQFMGNVDGLNARKVKENQEELYIADAPLDSGSSSNSSAAKQERQSSHTSKLFCYVS